MAKAFWVFDNSNSHPAIPPVLVTRGADGVLLPPRLPSFDLFDQQLALLPVQAASQMGDTRPERVKIRCTRQIATPKECLMDTIEVRISISESGKDGFPRLQGVCENHWHEDDMPQSNSPPDSAAFPL